MNRYSIILAAAVLLCCLPIEAQYKKNKTRYDHKAYVYKSGDRYIPVLAGFCSLPVPGLGQAISGEPIRGLAFLGGSVVCCMSRLT